MKKILCLLICAVLSLTVLVGCSKGNIGDYLENYVKIDTKEEKLTLNMYIVVEDGTSENAKTTIKQIFDQHTSTTYNTSVKLNYVTASEYENTIANVINKTDKDAPHIVLITSKDMLDGLVAESKLVDLVPYLEEKAYQRLNTQVAPALLQAGRDAGRLYALPNSHIIGGNEGYEYLVIDLPVAEKELWYSKSELATYKSLEDASTLMADMTANGYNASELVSIVRGSYELKAQLEAQNKMCNIIKYPTATPEEAFAGAFAIVANEDNRYEDRAMRIINAINADSELRNILQYGVRGTNYHLDNDGNVVRVSEGDNVYYMNLRYTGDTFKALYCPELGWTKSAYDNGIKQNEEAVVAK